MHKRLLMLIATCVFVVGASAQVDYTETGDAGRIPETAQATGVNNSTPLRAIVGNLDPNDVDMFVIYINNPSAFVAEVSDTSSIYDPQLWLFDANGNGIVHDDDSAGRYRSRINNARGCIPGPGLYYIAISDYNVDAHDCNEMPMWNDSGNACAIPGVGRVGLWLRYVPGTGGGYRIVLQGASTSPLGSPPPCPPFDGWDEQANGGGDAGDGIETAQSTAGNFSAIRGTLPTGNDVDIYAITITDPINFRATTLNGTVMGTTLHLFNAEGKGVLMNDDAPGTGSSQSLIDNRSGVITQPGTYYLAISRGRAPVGCLRMPIWKQTPYNQIRTPDGPERTSRLTGWIFASSGIGTVYRIFLRGVAGATTGDPDECPPIPPWDEQEYGLGDAGDLPSTAQVVTLPDRRPCQDNLPHIRGGMLGPSDVDMYVICITNPSQFVASLVDTAFFDSQLWLFRCDGRGVVYNNNVGGTAGWVSRIDNSQNCITEPGIYLLAISEYPRRPVNASGQQLWQDSTTGIYCPNGPGAGTPFVGWSGNSSNANSLYLITLQGASFVSPYGCNPPCPGDVDLNGIVDDADLLTVLFDFGNTGTNLPADVDRNGVVDDADLLIVLFNFGCSAGG
ncbi:MAG: DVUA0089 family protein [Fimbriimonadales bacterium]